MSFRRAALAARAGFFVAIVALPLVPSLSQSANAQDGEITAFPGEVIDSDWDGVDDTTESYYGTNPYNPDSDGDGLRDGDEYYDRYAVSYPDKYDSDGDGLGDGVEVFQNGTNPILWDTDMDGRNDAVDREPFNPYG